MKCLELEAAVRRALRAEKAEAEAARQIKHLQAEIGVLKDQISQMSMCDCPKGTETADTYIFLSKNKNKEASRICRA